MYTSNVGLFVTGCSKFSHLMTMCACTSSCIAVISCQGIDRRLLRSAVFVHHFYWHCSASLLCAFTGFVFSPRISSLVVLLRETVVKLSSRHGICD